MNHRFVFSSVTFALVAAFATGCSSAREVEVTGTVSSAAAAQGPIALEFFSVDGEGEDAVRESAKTATLDAPGDFIEKVEIAGDVVIVVAVADTDADGKCTEGEAWGEAEATIADDDTVAAVAIDLVVAPCPAPVDAD